MLPEEKKLNNTISQLYDTGLRQSTINELADHCVKALKEQREAGKQDCQVALQIEETRVQQRLLSVLREQFQTYYQGFDGSFDEWLELRGLRFSEDRFLSVPFHHVGNGCRSLDYSNYKAPIKSNSCKEKALPGEPIFTLRGQDKTAWKAVSHWVALNPEAPIEKLIEALQTAQKMKDYTPQKQAD